MAAPRALLSRATTTTTTRAPRRAMVTLTPKPQKTVPTIERNTTRISGPVPAEAAATGAAMSPAAASTSSLFRPAMAIVLGGSVLYGGGVGLAVFSDAFREPFEKYVPLAPMVLDMVAPKTAVTKPVVKPTAPAVPLLPPFAIESIPTDESLDDILGPETLPAPHIEYSTEAVSGLASDLTTTSVSDEIPELEPEPEPAAALTPEPATALTPEPATALTPEPVPAPYLTDEAAPDPAPVEEPVTHPTDDDISHAYQQSSQQQHEEEEKEEETEEAAEEEKHHHSTTEVFNVHEDHEIVNNHPESSESPETVVASTVVQFDAEAQAEEVTNDDHSEPAGATQEHVEELVIPAGAAGLEMAPAEEDQTVNTENFEPEPEHAHLELSNEPAVDTYSEAPSDTAPQPPEEPEEPQKSEKPSESLTASLPQSPSVQSNALDDVKEIIETLRGLLLEFAPPHESADGDSDQTALSGRVQQLLDKLQSDVARVQEEIASSDQMFQKHSTELKLQLARRLKEAAEYFNRRIQAAQIIVDEANKKADKARMDSAEGAEKYIRENMAKIVGNERSERRSLLTKLALDASALELLLRDHMAIQREHTALHRLLAALDATEDAVAARTSFRQPLEALRTAAMDSDLDTAAMCLDTIRSDVADRGVATMSDLRRRFIDVRRAVSRAAYVDEHGGMWAHLTSSVLSVLSVKPSSYVEGDDIEAILARADYFLLHNDLDAAAREINQLKGWQRRLAHDWLVAAREHLEVRQALDVVTAEASLMLLSTR